MPKTRRTPSGVVDQLREYIQELPLRRAVGTIDRRSVARTQRLERQLSGEARPKQIAEELGISTQKWVALRRGIQEGRIASPNVADLIERTSTVDIGKPSLAKIEYLADVPHKGRRKKEGQVWETSEGWVKQNAPWMRDLKPGGFADKKSALNWWGNAGAGSQYFAIVRKRYKGDRTRYHIYDMRTAKELANKGQGRANARALRATKILKGGGNPARR